jgi:acyl-CoA dehydrogenase
VSTAWVTGDVLAPDIGNDHDAPTWGLRAREFARAVVAPLGAVVDAMDPEDLVGSGSLLRDLLAQAQLEGFTRLGAPEHLGGIPAAPLDELRVLEELATADASLAVLLVAAPAPFRWAGAFGPSSLADDLAAPYLAAARTDWIGCCAVAGAAGVRATRAGSGWALTGATPAVPAGAVATHALVACTLDQGENALAVVPLAAAGVERVRVQQAPGLRALCPARLVFERVHLRADHVVVPHAGQSRDLFGAYAHAVLALVAFGLGRAAYEGTLRWTREAVWSGRLSPGGGFLPLLHQMQAQLYAARTVARATYHPGPAPLPAGVDEDEHAAHARAARAFATDVAFELAQTAVRLCGADARGVPFLDGSAFSPEKLLRDAVAAHIPVQEEQDGTRQDA